MPGSKDPVDGAADICARKLVTAALRQATISLLCFPRDEWISHLRRPFFPSMTAPIRYSAG